VKRILRRLVQVGRQVVPWMLLVMGTLVWRLVWVLVLMMVRLLMLVVALGMEGEVELRVLAAPGVKRDRADGALRGRGGLLGT